MILLLLILYLVVLLSPFWIRNKLPIFHPAKIISVIYFIYSVPFLAIAVIDHNLVVNDLVVLKYSDNINDLIVKYILYQLIGIIFLFIGVFIPMKKKKSKMRFIILKGKETYKATFRKFLFFIVLGYITFLYVVINSNGITGLILMMESGGSIGLTQFVIFQNICLFISAIYLMKSFSLGKVNKVVVLCIYVSYFIIFSLYGGRSNFVLLILISFYSSTIFSNKIKLINIRNLIVVFMVLFYIVIAPVLRRDTSNLTADYVLKVAEKNLLTLAKGNEYVSIQLTILGGFNSSNIWCGTSYKDLLYSIIPSSIYKDKPPVDEGMYIYNNLIGNNYSPSTPMRIMEANSWPPGTMGIMFSNFHFLGILFGYLILGLVYNFLYRELWCTKFNAPIVFVYLFTVIKFELTNFYIFNLIMILFILMLLRTVSRFFMPKE